MSTFEGFIDVDVPLRAAYDQWTQFEDFPKFMEGIESVTQLDDKSVRWRAVIGGKPIEWTARIYEQVPDRTIAWRSIDGAEQAGIVSFEAIDAHHTRVSLELTYEPHGFLQTLGDAFGLVSRRIDRDLAKFKQYIEGHGQETGGWRGVIHDDQTQSQPRA